MLDKYMKMCSVSLLIRGNANDNRGEMSVTSHLLEGPSSKTQELTNAGEDAELREHLCTVGENVN